jgi:hypothetical protein
VLKIDHIDIPKHLEIFVKIRVKNEYKVLIKSRDKNYIVIKIWHVRYIKNYKKCVKKLVEFLWNFSCNLRQTGGVGSIQEGCKQQSCREIKAKLMNEHNGSWIMGSTRVFGCVEKEALQDFPLLSRSNKTQSPSCFFLHFFSNYFQN